MISIQELLENRIKASQNGTLKEQLVIDRKEYNKKWADAVEFFRIKINKEYKDKPFPFMAIRQKLEAVKNIEDLRWFYFECMKYEHKKKGNSFAKCFFGALKIK